MQRKRNSICCSKQNMGSHPERSVPVHAGGNMVPETYA